MRPSVHLIPWRLNTPRSKASYPRVRPTSSAQSVPGSPTIPPRLYGDECANFETGLLPDRSASQVPGSYSQASGAGTVVLEHIVQCGRTTNRQKAPRQLAAKSAAPSYPVFRQGPEMEAALAKAPTVAPIIPTSSGARSRWGPTTRLLAHQGNQSAYYRGTTTSKTLLGSVSLEQDRALYAP